MSAADNSESISQAVTSHAANAEYAGQPVAEHIKQIDGLRALAILMVYAFHSLAIPQLWCGVDLFFILSGFLITGILLRDVPRFTFPQLAARFYSRRAQRILPAYCVVMVAAVFLVNIPWRHLWPWYAFFAQNVPIAFAWIDPNALAPLWSLGVENQFYLLWPLIVFFIPRRWLVPSMMVLLVGTPILRFFATRHFSDSAVIFALTPFRLDTLAAGALFALTLHKVKPAMQAVVRRRAQIIMGISTLVLIAVTLRYPWFRRANNARIYNASIYSFNIVILGSLFVWARFSTGPLTRFLSHPVLGWLGRISYMFYLSHLFFLLKVQSLLQGRMQSAMMVRVSAAVVAFVLTCAFSTLSWILLEKPVLNFRRKSKLTQQEIANAQAAA